MVFGCVVLCVLIWRLLLFVLCYFLSKLFVRMAPGKLVASDYGTCATNTT